MARERARATHRAGLRQPLYEIRVKGCLEGWHWAQWFDAISVSASERGETVLRVAPADQAALYGLLARLRDLALPLVSVNMVEITEPQPAGAPAAQEDPPH